MAAAALAEARALGDEAAEAKILWNELNVNRLIQRQPLARAAGERSLEIARRLGLEAQAALSVHDLTHVYAEMGLWPEADQASAEARQRWQALGNHAMLADNLATAALYHGLRGRFAEAIAEALAANQQARAIGNPWGQAYSLLTVVWPYWYSGQPAQALEKARACLQIEAMSASFTQVVAAWIGLIYADLGDPRAGMHWVRQAAQGLQPHSGLGWLTVQSAQVHLELCAHNLDQAATTLAALEAESQHPAIFEFDAVLRARSEVALARGEAGPALAATQAQVARLRARGLLQPLPEALGGLAQAWRLNEQPDQAAAALAEAVTLAEAQGAAMTEWPARYALGRLALERGDAASSRRHWARAREIVTSLADRIPAPELRQSFRARPELRALMGE
jgi:tetratricopeptide (TPR) repeat protein